MKNNYILKNSLLMLLSVLGYMSYAQTNITFQVDMTQQSGFTTPEVNGTFNNWCGSACNPMTDANSDGIWETTIQLAPGNYEYKFAADNWTTQETLLPGSACTVTNFGFTNRTLSVGTSVITLPVICWGSCSACVTSTPLTITVDLCGQTAQQVRMTGAFWNWAPNAGPVAVNTGNNNWKFTLNPPPASTMEYLIVVDSVYENLISEMQNGATCAPSTDYATYANRVWTPGSSDSVNIFYNRCMPCATGINELDETNIHIFPNPSKEFVYIKSSFEMKTIMIYDLAGKKIKEINSNAEQIEIDTKTINPGHYLIQISNENKKINKLIVINSN